MPDDQLEDGRLDIQHHTWLLSLRGKLHVSPIPGNIQHVLDVGCGKGHWPIKFAKEHPSAQVLGTDLNPTQPAGAPPNCSFMIHNAESEWNFDMKFAFIHSRMIVMGIHDWPRYFKRAWDILLPGRWLEVQEVQYPACCADDTVEVNSPVLLWSQYAGDAAAKAGLDLTVTGKFKEPLADQGFVNIREQPMKWAIGPWPKGSEEKEIGKWTLENTKQLLSPVSLALFTKQLGWSVEQVEDFLIRVREDLADRTKHYYWQMLVNEAAFQNN